MDRQKKGRYGFLLVDAETLEAMAEAANDDVSGGAVRDWDSWDILDLIATYRALQAALDAERGRVTELESTARRLSNIAVFAWQFLSYPAMVEYGADVFRNLYGELLTLRDPLPPPPEETDSNMHKT